MGDVILIKFKGYYCLDCGKYFQIEFTGRYENYCNFFNEAYEQ